MLNIRDNAPVTEPERQYYFMDICSNYVAKLEEELGHKPTCCVTPFGCQMNSRDSEKLVGILEKVGYEVIEERIVRERLYLADEVFFTGTAAEVTPISSIDHRTIGIGRRGPISEKLQSTFFDIVEAKVEDKYGWLSYI